MCLHVLQHLVLSLSELRRGCQKQLTASSSHPPSAQKMSKLQSLKLFVNQRLNAAVEEIFGHFERTIIEYEEELDRRHQSQLDVVLRREIKLPTGDVKQLLVSTDQVSPEQTWSSSAEQEDPEPRLIKEEIQDVWNGEGGEGEPLEEEDRLSSFVKTENIEQSLQLRHSRKETCESVGEASVIGVISANSQRNDRTSNASEPETEVSDNDCGDAREPHSGFNSLRSNDVHFSRDVKPNAGKKFFVCGECGRKFGRKDSLRRHMRYHTGEKPYSCSVCGKRFSQRPNLIRHMRCHSGEKPFRCSFCDTSFSVRSALVNHMRIHTGEKPYSCVNCDKSFTQRGGLKKHMTVHTGEKPYICTICNKSFSQKANLTYHFSVHTGLKQFSCSVCDKRFTWQSQVKSHKCVGETSSNNLS